MLWGDFTKGDHVQIDCDDYADPGAAVRGVTQHESPFTVTGIVFAVTQRTMWVCGCWRWHTPSPCDAFTDDDPEFTGGTFQIPRRGPEKIRRYNNDGSQDVWLAPMPE